MSTTLRNRLGQFLEYPDAMSTLKERFDAKWMPEPFSGCWLWTGCFGGRCSYGYISEGSRRMPRSPAHRVAWLLYRGVIPDGLFVLHKCDTPMCVNPDHLFLGTQADNLADARAKGRLNIQGEKHASAKLTAAQVREIRASNETQRALAQRFGVFFTTVNAIKRERTYRNVDDA